MQTLAINPSTEPEKKVSSKVTKAQRRAQQAEFNRQLWAEAYVLLSTTFFLSLRLIELPMAVKHLKHFTMLKRALRLYPSSRTSNQPSPFSAADRRSQLGSRAQVE
jgi:hypothetical protein